MGDSQYSFSLTTFRFDFSVILDLLVRFYCSSNWYISVLVILLDLLLLFNADRNSPSGKLVQIEHALQAVGSGQTSLGIKGASYELSRFANTDIRFCFVLCYIFINRNYFCTPCSAPQKMVYLT